MTSKLVNKKKSHSFCIKFSFAHQQFIQLMAESLSFEIAWTREFLLLLKRFIIVTAYLQPAEVKNCATIMTVHYFMTHDVFVSPFD